MNFISKRKKTAWDKCDFRRALHLLLNRTWCQQHGMNLRPAVYLQNWSLPIWARSVGPWGQLTESPHIPGSLSPRYRVSFHSCPNEGLSPQVCECKAQWLFVLVPLSPLLDTWLLHTLGLHGEMLSVSLLVQVLPLVFPGEDDIPDQTKATDPKGENKSPLLLFGNFLAFLPQKPQILFQNHQVIWALMSLQPIVMKNAQQSEQIPHCKREQKIHLKCVFLSILLLAFVCVCFMSLEEQG